MGFGVRKQPPAPGLEVILPGNKVIVPELSNGQRRSHPDLLKKWDEMDRTQPDWLKTWEDLAEQTVLLALERNYPDIKIEDVLEFTRSDLLSGANYALNGPMAQPLWGNKPGEPPAVPALVNGAAPTA